jgi:hypothetical protein
MEVKINQPATKIAVGVKARTQISATKPELKKKKRIYRILRRQEKLQGSG